ncbi:MAG: VOC family protein [Candidatus Wallbacteria bacterium]|nr:VOC family protein [Candidatus Wallbacteria bacterium]
MEPDPDDTAPGFCHAALRVRDLARSERFYVEGFGLRVEWRPDPQNVYLTSGADNLALHETGALADPRSPDCSLDHLGFVVRRREDVDRLAERMRERDVEFLHPVKDHRDGARSCYVRDPDGNTVQIIHHPPISEPRNLGSKPRAARGAGGGR